MHPLTRRWIRAKLACPLIQPAARPDASAQLLSVIRPECCKDQAQQDDLERQRARVAIEELWQEGEEEQRSLGIRGVDQRALAEDPRQPDLATHRAAAASSEPSSARSPR